MDGGVTVPRYKSRKGVSKYTRSVLVKQRNRPSEKVSEPRSGDRDDLAWLGWKRNSPKMALQGKKAEAEPAGAGMEERHRKGYDTRLDPAG